MRADAVGDGLLALLEGRGLELQLALLEGDAGAEGDAEDIDAAVKAARVAFEDGRWRNKHPREKKKIMFKLAELMERDLEELAFLETLDMGKPIRATLSVDIPTAINSIRWYAEALDKVYGEVATTPSARLSFIVREPLGVVGAIVPWNFPMLMAAWKFAPALAMGNSVVLKPSEKSPLTAIRLAEIAMEAGIPAGVFNVLPCFGKGAGESLALHMDVDGLVFTGSTAVGKHLLQCAGRSNLKRAYMECGGKSPNIIFADAPNLKSAAISAAYGIFYNQGEVCTAASRLLVQREIKNEFLAMVMETGRKLMPKHPLEPTAKMGAMVDATQMKNVLGYIEKGKAEGAKLSMGGVQAHAESGGFYIEPTVFENVDAKMTIAQEEIFGPVLSAITFDTEDEALRIANDSPYGLAAAVWTNDISRAHRVARKLRAGSVWVNCYDGGDMTAPFGGYKQSGNGRDKSLHAFEKYTELKATWINLQP